MGARDSTVVCSGIRKWVTDLNGNEFALSISSVHQHQVYGVVGMNDDHRVDKEQVAGRRGGGDAEVDDYDCFIYRGICLLIETIRQRP